MMFRTGFQANTHYVPFESDLQHELDFDLQRRQIEHGDRQCMLNEVQNVNKCTVPA